MKKRSVYGTLASGAVALMTFALCALTIQFIYKKNLRFSNRRFFNDLNFNYLTVTFVR